MLRLASMSQASDSALPASNRLPPQVPFIIGNEAAERFSFYGMRAILTTFLASAFFSQLAADDATSEAKHIFHTFMIGVYFFPLLGGWLSDRFLGKYKTILGFSLIYCVGHACLAVFETSKNGFLFGLFLIALGAGGIKPLVSSFVGDQFTQKNKHIAKLVFEAFYWSINFGSFFASLFTPVLLKHWGARVAFGLPGILMLLATLIYWAGRRHYVIVPPGDPDPHSFGRVAKTALRVHAPARSAAVITGLLAIGVFLALWMIPVVRGTTPTYDFTISFCLALLVLIAGAALAVQRGLDHIGGGHPEAAVQGVRQILRLLVLFFFVTAFHSLFDQKASTWVAQGKAMESWWLLPAQMQFLNPALVMLMIPFNNMVLYPWLKKRGLDPTPLRRMAAGIAIAGIAWIVVGVLQMRIDAGLAPSLAWQATAYLPLTFGEVLVSATGLEFAYSQAPRSMKGVVMSGWLLTTTFGNLWVLLTDASVKSPSVLALVQQTGLGTTAFLMFFFAVFAFAAAAGFAFFARRYQVVEKYASE